MNVKPLCQSIHSYLPTGVDPTGTSVARLNEACQANLADPTSPDPYGDMKDHAQANRDLIALGRQAQSDFGSAPLTIGQLARATRAAENGAKAAAASADSDLKALRKSYYKQVGRTTAWMAATAGSLFLGGIFPNPISVVVIGGASVMTIKSLNKSRAKHAELVAKTPALEANLKASRELAASAGFYAPLVTGWDQLLSPPPATQAA